MASGRLSSLLVQRQTSKMMGLSELEVLLFPAPGNCIGRLVYGEHFVVDHIFTSGFAPYGVTYGHVADGRGWVTLQRLSDNHVFAKPSLSPAAPSEASSDDELCVVCLEAPKDAGLLHGSTIHKCVCIGCANSLLKSQSSCPVCRSVVERVVSIF
jgi:Zinc finger, C3HC4 type (RING finger)